MRTVFSNKKFRKLGYILAGIALSLFILQALFQHFSKRVIEDLVAKQTKGKVSLTIGKVRLKLFPDEVLVLRDTKFEFLDEKGEKVQYDLSFKFLELQLHSLKSFLVDKELLVDYLLAESPAVGVHPASRKKDKIKANYNVQVKIGNIYLALRKVVAALQVKRFGLRNGMLTLHELEPNKKTIRFGGLNLSLKELAMLEKTDENLPGLTLDRLNLNTGSQDIEFPEGDYRIRYGKMEFDTENNAMSIDQLQVNSQSGDSSKNELDIQLQKLQLSNINFQTLYKENRFEVDSMICQNPVINMDLDLTKKKNNTPYDGLLLEKKIAGLIGRIKMNYLGLLNSNITINAKGKTNNNSFNTNGNNFIALNVNIDSAKAIPIEIGKLQFAIKNFQETLKNGKYNIQFDSVLYDNMALSLLNFRMKPTKNNRDKDKKYFNIPTFTLTGLDLYELILNKYLKANELTLSNASFINNYEQKKNTGTNPKSIKSYLNDFSEQIDLEKIRINNGFVRNKSINSKKEIVIGGIQSEISVNEIFDLSTYEAMATSIEKMNFDSAIFISGNQKIQLEKGEFVGAEKSIKAKSFALGGSQNKITADNVRIHNYKFNDDLTNISIDSIFYGSASFQLNQKPREKNNVKEEDEFELQIKYLLAGPTKLAFTSRNQLHANTDLEKIILKDFSLNAENEIKLSDLDMAGKNIQLSSPNLQLQTYNFSITDNNNSFFNNITIDLKKEKDTIQAFVPSVRFVPSLAKSLAAAYPILEKISMMQPKIKAAFYNNTTTNNTNAQWILGKIDITNANLDIRKQQGNKSIAVKSVKLNLAAASFSSHAATGLVFEQAKMFTNNFHLMVNDSMELNVNNGEVGFAIDNFKKTKENTPKSFTTSINSIIGKNVNFSMVNKKGEPFALKEFNVGGQQINIDSADAAHVLRQLKKNPSLYINDIDLEEVTESATLLAHGIGYSNGGKTVSIDSFSYTPKKDRESFMKMNTYQKDHMQFKTGKISIRNLDIERLATDSNLQLNYIIVENPILQVYKDKRLPLQPGYIKAMPVALLKKIKQRLHVDSLRLVNGKIYYEEFNDKTEMLAKLHLSDLQTLISNIDNYNTSATDSLYIVSTSRFLDTANISLRFHESYADSISSFLYRVRIGRFGLPALNSVILPTANMKINRGWLDTMELKVMGNDYLAHGKMRMYYKDFRIQFLSNKELEKRTIFTKVLSWLANGFLRSNNVEKTGTVFTERTREKSFVNYWVKIVLSGAMTNTRIRKNSKQEKRYQKALKRIKVPELPEVDL
ncbi:MAG: hypothetical protein RLZZ595_1936 [Bacteroidota bacterium]